MNENSFEWLSCEHSLFVGVVYDLAQPIHLRDYDYDTLVSTAPDAAYIVDVEYRTQMLVNRFESLNMVYQMLALEELPLSTPLGAISRQNWVRITLDVLLSRLTSIRDCAFLLIAEIFELGLNPRDVSRRSLKNSSTISEEIFHTL
ncbi:MAG: hypothetical protein HS126_28115 [Anaerolineales bacterium]|nr:hypothetical protein [Anaerolineales bacterium]